MLGFIFRATLAWLCWNSVYGRCSISQSEYNALNDFYTSTNGSSWRWRGIFPQWVFPSPLWEPCTQHWEGLICNKTSSTTCTIHEIALPGRNLDGALPTTISNLVNLQRLLLRRNKVRAVPVEIGNLSNLLELDLGFNYLNSLQEGISKLSKLQLLYLFENFLTGPIPTSYGELISLNSMYLFRNQLTGPIPDSFSSLTQMVYFSLYSNSLSGPIPSSISTIPNLKYIELYFNSLTGPIPNEMAQLASLIDFIVYNNLLSGTIPTALGLMSSIYQISLSSNSFSGPIPATFCSSTVLYSFFVAANHLNESIPSCFSSMPSLGYFTAYSNQLTGEIPTSFSGAKSLISFSVAFNLLTGKIPSDLLSLPKIAFLYLNGNSLTGKFPNEISQSVSGLFCENNLLTGTISPLIFESNVLNCLSLYSNWFSGTLSVPTHHGNTSLQLLQLNENLLEGEYPFQNAFNYDRLIQLDLSNNLLTGSIAEVTNIPTLEYLFLQSNGFSDSIPSDMANLSQLVNVNLSSNFFTGNLNQYSDGKLHHFSRLDNIDISSNGITGDVPTVFFKIWRLKTLSLGSNCFNFFNLSHLCKNENSSISTFIFDAASSSNFCSVKLSKSLRFFVRGTFAKHLMTQEIPQCVFEGKLHTLHLSGLGLIGKIPEISQNSSIRHLALTNNHLSGSIPFSFQTKGDFIQLYLSSNKLSGTLSKAFRVVSKEIIVINGDSFHTENSSDIDLSLSSNRLSGYIPSILNSQPTLNILEGNVFSCANIPSHDTDSQHYICGSRDYNIALIISGSVGVLLVVLFFLLPFIFGQVFNMKSNFLWKEQLMFVFQHDDIVLKYYLDTICKLSLLVAQNSLVLVILVVCYIVFKTENILRNAYSMLYIQYAWTVTISFLHGVAPSVVIGVVVMFMLIRFTIFNLNQKDIFVQLEKNSTDESALKQRQSSWSYILPLFLHLTNITMTLLVNGAYVYAYLSDLTSFELICVQSLLGLFKILWSNIFISWSFRQLYSSFRGHSWTSRAVLQHSLLMNVVNFVVSPFLATLFTDSNCFYYAIVGSTPVSIDYFTNDQSCHSKYFNSKSNGTALFSTQCIPYFMKTPSTFNPPWSYSYSCSSAVLQNYLPVLTYSYIFSGFLVPFAVVVYLLLLQKTGIRKVEDDATHNVLHDLTNELDDKFNDSTTVQSSSSYSYDVNVIPSNELLQRLLDRKLVLNLSNLPENISKFFFPSCYSGAVICKIGLHCIVWMTFGMSSPLLGMMVLSAITGEVIVSHLLSGRIVTMRKLLSSAENRNVALLNDIDESIRCLYVNVASNCKALILITSCFVLMFWSYFLYDFIGDVYGGINGAIVSLSFFVVGNVVVILLYLFLPESGISSLFSSSSKSTSTSASTSASSELETKIRETNLDRDMEVEFSSSFSYRTTFSNK